VASLYSGTDISQIESIRRLLNLKFFTEAVQRSGASNTATIHFRGWVDAAKLLQPDLLISISAEELRSQFRRFMAKLEELAHTLKKLEIFSLDPSLHHYTDIQSVLAILSNASVAMGLHHGASQQLRAPPHPGQAGVRMHGRYKRAGRGAV